MSEEIPKPSNPCLSITEILLNQNQPTYESMRSAELINDALFGNMENYWEDKERRAKLECNFIVHRRDIDAMEFTEMKETK